MSYREIYDASGTIVRTVHVQDDGSLTYELAQDCEPIIEAARVRRDMPMDRDMRPVAEVPTVVVERALREGWFNDQAAWRKWLNDPDNRLFRVWEGRV